MCNFCEFSYCFSCMKVCTWNVEGLTEVKTHEICSYMQVHGIDVCGIQETRVSKSDYYDTDDGFMVILSGSAGENREWAGVGFILSPGVRHRLQPLQRKGYELEAENEMW